ncbi:hypothetical protein GBA52_015259 [Prunus armeniaca]|nr:hypothetical protein GBA52_015259 [Prunus armeniaca]
MSPPATNSPCRSFDISPHPQSPSTSPDAASNHEPISPPPFFPNTSSTISTSLDYSPMHTKFGSLQQLIYGTSPHPLPHSLTASLQVPLSFEPATYKEASQYSHWQTAMKDEYDALIRNDTWSLVPVTQGMNIIGCKWVYKVKRKADVTIERHKARLVAQGYC